MAVTIVQSAVPFESATNPSVALQRQVTAGNTLLTLIAMLDPGIPGQPTDTLGNSFGQIAQNVVANPQGQHVAIASYVAKQSVAGGHDTVNFPTTGPSQLVLAELGNVHALVPVVNSHGNTFFNPDIPDAESDLQGFGQTIGLNIGTGGPSGSLVYALLAIDGAPSVTFTGPGWAQVANGTSLGLTFYAVTTTTTGPSNLSASWTLSAPSYWVYMAVSIPSA